MPHPRRLVSLLFVTLVVTAAPAAAAATRVIPIERVRGALLQSTDLYLINTGAQPVDVTLELRRRGTAEATPPAVSLTIAAGEALVLADVVSSLFDRENIAGFLLVRVVEREQLEALYVTALSTAGEGNSQRITGAASPRAQEPAHAGQAQYLVGLRQDAAHDTTLWLLNPGAEANEVRLDYFDASGVSLGGSRRIGSAAGQVRTSSLADHPLADDIAYVTATVVRGGLLSAARIVSRLTNDPAYVAGETR